MDGGKRDLFRAPASGVSGVLLRCLALIALCLKLACGGGSQDSRGAAPANLTYSSAAITGIVGQAITPTVPTVTGTVESYTIAPSLPQGLSLHTTTGVLSGTPATFSPKTTYTVTARNASGSTAAAIQIQVDSRLRLIHMGGGGGAATLPTADKVVAVRATFEQGPFDGIMFALQAGRTVFQTTRYTPTALAADRVNLPLINSPRLTDNFLVIRGGAVTGFDRFSDAHWAIALANIRAFAQMAKLGNLKGIAFDPEAYDGQNSLFDYRSYDSATYTFQDCQANIRRRGQQVMAVIQEEHPGSVLFLLGGLSMLRDGTRLFHPSDSFPTRLYGLMPDFLNGILDVLAPGMKVVDGCEASYTFYRSTWYANLKTLVLTTGQSLLDAGNRPRYQNQLELGLSIYFDASFDQRNNPGVLAHHLDPTDRPAFFNYQVYWGLTQASRYVWIYAETTDWVNRSGIPAGAEAAMVDAKTKASGSLPLGSDIEPKIQAAALRGGLEW